MWDKYSLFRVVITYLVYVAHTQVNYAFSITTTRLCFTPYRAREKGRQCGLGVPPSGAPAVKGKKGKGKVMRGILIMVFMRLFPFGV